MSWLSGQTVDLVLLAYVAMATLAGFRAGLVMAVCGFAGRLAAIYIAWRLAPKLAASGAGSRLATALSGWLAAHAGTGQAGGSPVPAPLAAAVVPHTAQLLVWVICLVLVLLVAGYLLNASARIVSGVLKLIPVIGGLNRVGGGLAGFAGAAATIAVLAVLATSARGWFHSPRYDAVLAGSRAATALAPVGQALLAEAGRLAPALTGPAGFPGLPALAAPPGLTLPPGLPPPAAGRQG